MIRILYSMTFEVQRQQNGGKISICVTAIEFRDNLQFWVQRENQEPSKHETEEVEKIDIK